MTCPVKLISTSKSCGCCLLGGAPTAKLLGPFRSGNSPGSLWMVPFMFPPKLAVEVVSFVFLPTLAVAEALLVFLQTLAVVEALFVFLSTGC